MQSLQNNSEKLFDLNDLHGYEKKHIIKYVNWSNPDYQYSTKAGWNCQHVLHLLPILKPLWKVVLNKQSIL